MKNLMATFILGASALFSTETFGETGVKSHPLPRSMWSHCRAAERHVKIYCDKLQSSGTLAVTYQQCIIGDRIIEHAECYLDRKKDMLYNAVPDK